MTNLGFNSNPLKPKNRELLNPTVKEAFEYGTPRQQIINVVFDGYGKPWANLISSWSTADGWVNPAVQPLPYDPAKANQILDGLGYREGGNGIRVVPATTGLYAQPAHEMSYGVVVPNDLDFDGDRQFQILASAYGRSASTCTRSRVATPTRPTRSSPTRAASTCRRTCTRGTGTRTSTPTSTCRR